MASGESFMKSVANSASEAIEKMASGDGLNSLRSNEAINKFARKTGKFILGEADTGIRGTLSAVGSGKGVKEAVKSAYTVAGKDAAGNATRNINWKAVGGTYVGAAAAGRVLTGGGVYRDSSGNVNLPVVPFV